MSDARAVIMPGRFVCTKCGVKLRLRYTPGVLEGRGPVGPLTDPCPRCGGAVAPRDGAALETAADAADRGKELAEELARLE